MNTAIGLALLILGVVLVVFGINASQSLGSELSETFTGAPSNNAIWLLSLGILSGVIGLVLLVFRGARRS